MIDGGGGHDGHNVTRLQKVVLGDKRRANICEAHKQKKLPIKKECVRSVQRLPGVKQSG